jgi:signal transduction histidine kinase
MRLLNQSLLFLLAPLFAVITVWAVVFYFNMLDEVYDSIDDGLDNSKILIIRKAREEDSILDRHDFAEGNYAIREIGQTRGLKMIDVYRDTLMYMVNEEEMEPVRLLTTAFAQDGKYYELRIINSMVEEDDQIANLFWSVISLYLLLLVSIALINNWGLKNLWKPFYDYLDQLKRFRLDRSDSLASMDTNIREFQELKHSADTLMLHSREVYKNQKQFNENAAHELQTPLAVITNKLELLLEEETLPPKAAATVGELLETTSRLIQLNRSLLLLSKIENKQFLENKPVSLNQVILRVEDELDELITFRQLDFRIQAHAELVFTMNAHLAYILLGNLLRNAILHNYWGGRISVNLDTTSLTISNTSRAAALASGKVFTRFYKTEGGHNGTGLGLAIVRAICQLYGIGIAYDFSGGEHRFTMTLPPSDQGWQYRMPGEAKV